MSPISHCICSIISLFGLPVNASEYLIGCYSNRGVDHLEDFTIEINELNNL